MGIRETLFEQHFPAITEDEAISQISNPAVSVNGYSVADGFVLWFATEENVTPPILLSEYVLKRLRALLAKPRTDA